MNKLFVPLFLILTFLLLSGCVKEEEVIVDETTAPSEDELGRDMVKWTEAYPLQAGSNDLNHQELASPSGYNGSIPFQRWDLTPEIVTNYDGIAFSKDYKEDRGHVYAWEDLFETTRTTEESPGACISCKTSDMEFIYEEYGWDYASMKMYDFRETGHAGIDCLSCHDEETHHLRVIQPAFIEAMETQGINPLTAPVKDLKTYVCAQCHSEYYFEPGTTRVVFPWANGLAPDEMYTYYQEEPSGFTGDYTNGFSNTRMLKAQHPDYEMFQSGIHASAGISCADCHMPHTEMNISDGSSELITQHWITSPLHTIKTSCLSCHNGKNEEWMLDRVRYIQNSVFASMRRAGLAIEEAHLTIEKAMGEGISEIVLTEARDTLREAQWYWDFTASANSAGFHNSELAHSNLSLATDLAHKSIERVLKAYL